MSKEERSDIPFIKKGKNLAIFLTYFKAMILFLVQFSHWAAHYPIPSQGINQWIAVNADLLSVCKSEDS